MADDCTRKPVRLVLLDRDGVINVDSPDYVKSPSEWHPVPGALAAIARLNAAGIHTALCSNQAGIGRGRLSARDLARIHVRFERELLEHNGHLDLWRFCPHSPTDDCGCRKPASGMLADCIAELGITPDACVFIGDSLKDMHAALDTGCLPILVRTGTHAGTIEQEAIERQATAAGVTIIKDDLPAAVQEIVVHHTGPSA